MFRLILLISMSWGLLCSMCASENTKEAFTRDFLDYYSKQSPESALKVVEPLLLSSSSEKGDFIYFLDEPYENSLDIDYNKNKIFSEFTTRINTSLEKNRSIITKARIVPLIKSSKFIDEKKNSIINLGIDIKQLDMIWEKYNDSLIILYALDTFNNLRFLTNAYLESANIKKEQLRGIAVSNLKNIIPPIDLVRYDNFYLLAGSGDFEVSLVLIDSIWSSKEIQVDGQCVIALPSIDVLLITGSNNKKGIKKIKDMAIKSAKDKDFFLCDDLFIYDGKNFNVYRPEELIKKN